MATKTMKKRWGKLPSSRGRSNLLIRWLFQKEVQLKMCLAVESKLEQYGTDPTTSEDEVSMKTLGIINNKDETVGPSTPK